MIGLDFNFIDTSKLVTKAADDASFKNVAHGAASIRNTAIDSIKPGDGPSQPGTPPHTQTAGTTSKGKPKRGNLQRAIVFAVDQSKAEAVIGPRESVIGDAGAAHEHGGELFGDEYPERPYMAPSLDKNTTRFADSFAGSIGS